MEGHTKELKAEYTRRSINIFNDNITKSKIDRHLLDINDRITEEDIRNIRVTIPNSTMDSRLTSGIKSTSK